MADLVLVVEDDPSIRRGVVDALAQVVVAREAEGIALVRLDIVIQRGEVVGVVRRDEVARQARVLVKRDAERHRHGRAVRELRRVGRANSPA